MVKVIGGAQEGEFKAVASGTLPNGKPVVVNADGTVSVAGVVDGSVSTPTAFHAADIFLWNLRSIVILIKLSLLIGTMEILAKERLLLVQ